MIRGNPLLDFEACAEETSTGKPSAKSRRAWLLFLFRFGLIDNHARDRAECDVDFGVVRFVHFQRHPVRFALHVGHHAVNAADRDHAVVFLDGDNSDCGRPVCAFPAATSGNKTVWR